MRLKGKIQLHPDCEYTTGEAAQALGVTRQTVRNWCKAKVLPFTREHGAARLYVRGSDLIRLKKGRAASGEQHR